MLGADWSSEYDYILTKDRCYSDVRECACSGRMSGRLTDIASITAWTNKFVDDAYARTQSLGYKVLHIKQTTNFERWKKNDNFLLLTCFQPVFISLLACLSRDVWINCVACFSAWNGRNRVASPASQLVLFVCGLWWCNVIARPCSCYHFSWSVKHS